jgi:hypothetical protein
MKIKKIDHFKVLLAVLGMAVIAVGIIAMMYLAHVRPALAGLLTAFPIVAFSYALTKFVDFTEEE